MPNHSEALDRVFHALADPTRRKLVERLVRGPASVSDLAQPLAMSLPAVMQHLSVLEACSLIRSEKAGRVRTCRIEPGTLRMAEAWMADARTSRSDPAPTHRHGTPTPRPPPGVVNSGHNMPRLYTATVSQPLVVRG